MKHSPAGIGQEGWSGTELITGKQLQGRVMLEPHGVAIVQRKK